MIDDPDPFDELDDLLLDGGPTDAVADPAPRQLVTPDRAEPARALAETPTVPVDAAPAVPLGQDAKRLTGKMLAGLETQFDRGEFDASDVMNLLPKVHKIAVDEAKLELARSDGRDNLPTFHITIGSGGRIQAERVLNSSAEIVEVVDQVPTEIPPVATATWLGSAGLPVDLQPIDGAFAS